LKATGIVRRIDDLGRVVIPKEIRRTLRIREGDPLEIYTDREGEIILKKYSPVSELSDFAQGYAEALHQTTKQMVLISDLDMIVAAAGVFKKEYVDKPISPELEKIVNDKKAYVAIRENIVPVCQEADNQFASQVIVPIISRGEGIGAVMILTKDSNIELGEVEVKLAETAANFLGKQLEE